MESCFLGLRLNELVMADVSVIVALSSFYISSERAFWNDLLTNVVHHMTNWLFILAYGSDKHNLNFVIVILYRRFRV